MLTTTIPLSVQTLSDKINAKWQDCLSRALVIGGKYNFEIVEELGEGARPGMKFQIFTAPSLGKKECFWKFSDFKPNEICHAQDTSPDIVKDQVKSTSHIRCGKSSNNGIKLRNPFLNPDPALMIGAFGDKHLLLLNKYCVLPRQLLLVTKEFESQDEPLAFGDFKAIAVVLGQLREGNEEQESKDYIVFYNCGRASGASQAHKHIQIIERPMELEELFPEEIEMELDSAIKTPYMHPNVPYDHFILPLPHSSTIHRSEYPILLHETFNFLLSEVSQSLASSKAIATNLASPISNFNMVMTSTWMMLVPRLLPCYDEIGANSLSMVGIMWVKNEQEALKCKKTGMKMLLTKMGVRRKTWMPGQRLEESTKALVVCREKLKGAIAFEELGKSIDGLDVEGKRLSPPGMGTGDSCISLSRAESFASFTDVEA